MGRELYCHALLIEAQIQDLANVMDEFRGVERAASLTSRWAGTANYFCPGSSLPRSAANNNERVQVRPMCPTRSRSWRLWRAGSNLAIMGSLPDDAELVSQTFLD